VLSGGPDLKSIFSPFDLESRKSVVAAVSGGSDSTALLVLLSDWLAAAAPQVRLFAVTVDHRLRRESAAEAEAVAAFCAARGIAHRIVAWSGEKPATGLSEAARLARYRLLAGAARDLGTDIVVTGHTLDDQVETVEMRRRRGGGRGLAGMAGATLHDGRCWILRPLLATRREALRKMLSAKSIGWAEDPTNRDVRYERPRLRAARKGDDDGAIAAIAAAQAKRRALGQSAAELVERYADRPVPGLVRLAPEFLAPSDRPAAIYALRILLAVVGGSRQLPDAARGAQLFDRLAAGPRGRATLSRCVADRRGSGLFLYRELRDLPVVTLGEGKAEWDVRFRIAGLAGSTVRAAGACDVTEDMVPDGVPLSFARAAMATQPVVCSSDGVTTEALGLSMKGSGFAPNSPSPSRFARHLSPVPGERMGARLDAHPLPSRSGGEVSSPKGETERGPDHARPAIEGVPQTFATPILAPWALFLPDFDLAPAIAAARLIGAEEPPTPPFTGHKHISA
jgi:tRNA(Ile)-lysidine synthase